MSSSKVVKKLTLSVSEQNAENDAKIVLKHIRPQWPSDEILFKVFTDGLSNKLFGCYLASKEDDVVLIRINGIGSELFINRDEELEAFRVLHEAQCAPPLHCVFNNGIAYGFFPGVTLDVKSIREEKIQRLIAKEMAKLHNVQGSSHTTHPEAGYKRSVQTMFESLPTSYEDPLKQNLFEKLIPNKSKLISEFDEILGVLEELKMKIVFCHNDILLKNIIYNEKEEKVHFIDYEYAFYNYEAYDIGNHFDEYAGMENLNYDLYPDKEEQVRWLRYYLESKAELEGRMAESVTSEDVEVLYVQTVKCSCAAHFYWTLWGLIQAKYSTIDFDYLSYANVRLSEYYRRKEEFFPLCLPSSS